MSRCVAPQWHGDMARRTVQRHPDGALHVSVHEEVARETMARGEVWQRYWQQFPTGRSQLAAFAINLTPASGARMLDRVPVLALVRAGEAALDGNLAPPRVLHGPEWSTTVTG